MTTAAGGIANRLGRTIGMVSAAMAVAMAQAPAIGQEVPSVRLNEMGIIVRGAGKLQLLAMEPIQQELRMTEAQKTEQAAIIKRRDRKLLETPMPPVNDPKFPTALGSLFREGDLAIQANLTRINANAWIRSNTRPMARSLSRRNAASIPPIMPTPPRAGSG